MYRWAALYCVEGLMLVCFGASGVRADQPASGPAAPATPPPSAAVQPAPGVAPVAEPSPALAVPAPASPVSAPAPTSASAAAEENAAPPPAGTAPAPPSVQPVGQAYDNERSTASTPAKKRRKIGLMIAGIAVFGAGYVGAAATYALNSDVLDATLLIPLAGPWITLGSVNWDNVTESDRTIDQVVIVMQGLLQGTGLVLSIIGISKYSASAHEDKAETDSVRSLTLQLAPTPGGVLAAVRGAL